MQLISILITGIVTNNVIFSKTIGICPFLGVSKNVRSGVSMGLAVTFVIMLSCLVCWVLNLALIALNIEYLQTVMFILIIACLVQMLDIILRKTAPSIYNSLGIYLALITTNCAVLGTANEIINLSLIESVLTSFSVGIGFMLALVLMAGVREKIETARIPKFFKGFPIALVAAAIMAMAYMGLNGISF